MSRNCSHWFLAIRPKTLPSSIAPVLLGTGMAFGDGVGHWPSALTALFGAMMIQIGTNLANDYFDSQSGVDTKERKGPIRVTQSGLIPPKQVMMGFVIAFGLAILSGLLLVARAGWPLLVIGIVSVVCGVIYAGGPRPLSHLGLGDIFVLVFFGPVAVAGTYYAQSYEINPAVIVAGLSCGFLSTAVLCVNNFRDIETDRKAGKRTLAVRFGRRFAKMEYLFCIVAACAIPPIVALMTSDHPFTIITSVVIFACMPLIAEVFEDGPAERMNQVLAQTGQALLIFTVIYSITWAI